MNKIRVILISSVLPSDSSAGNLILHRHLNGSDKLQLTIAENQRSNYSVPSVVRRAGGRIKFFSRKFGENLILALNGSWFSPPSHLATSQRTIVLTVAHGDLYLIAMKYAKDNSLPLVTFFHDWWPDIANVSVKARSRLEHQFRELYRQSSLALCVSKGMQKALGDHPNSRVLLPIPAKQFVRNTDLMVKTKSKIKIVYAGNLHEYGSMLASLMAAVKSHPSIELEVRGSNPKWPMKFQSEMRANGMWLPFVKGAAFDQWMSTADAFLIPQSFEPADRTMMETNFPSKLPEMAQWSRPLVLWGPETASGLQWGETGQAVAVTDADPIAVIKELSVLQSNIDRRRVLSRAANRSAKNEFNSTKIQRQFLDLIETLCSKPASLE